VTADPFARLDAVYLLGALDAGERLAYEAHLGNCRQCQASLAEISAIPPLLAGLDESVLAAPRGRRRLTTGLALLAAACAIALIVIVLPSGSGGQKPAQEAMVALVATPVGATIAMQPRSWGTEIHLTCWYPRGAAEPPSERYELVVHGTNGASYDLGNWRLAPGRRVIFTSGTVLTETQIKNLDITQPNGRAILALRVPRS
jgi:hypothetical protein